MPEDEVGVVIKYFAKPGVAAVKVTGGSIKPGDLLRYKGHTTDFTEQVTTMEIDRQPVEEARLGDMIGLKVQERERENDKVLKVED